MASLCICTNMPYFTFQWTKYFMKRVTCTSNPLNPHKEPNHNIHCIESHQPALLCQGRIPTRTALLTDTNCYPRLMADIHDEKLCSDNSYVLRPYYLLLRYIMYTRADNRFMLKYIKYTLADNGLSLKYIMYTLADSGLMII